jgi:predicted lipid-binding transport protein (Tim44 family)
MYLVAIGWLYVALLMALAEATSAQGSLLGAIVTFFLYGLMPVALVIHLMGRFGRPRRRGQPDDAQATATQGTETGPAASGSPDAGGHAPGAAEAGGVASVGKEQV